MPPVFQKIEGPPKIIFVGVFPPPVYGMAVANKFIADFFRLYEPRLILFDTSRSKITNSIFDKILRVATVLNSLLRIAYQDNLRGATLYISISGGLGQFFDLMFIILSKFKRMKLVMHHHSFAYLDRLKFRTLIMMKISEKSAIHIVLSERMGKLLSGIYCAKRVNIISNAAFCLSGKTINVKTRSELRTIGFLSNISKEKGIQDFIDLTKILDKKNFSITAKIAGPFHENGLENYLYQQFKKLKNIEYVGPKYGDEKNEFFNSIDVFVFPTRYVDEAEPMVVLEALSHGIPVIAYGRGCIPEILKGNCGRAIDVNEMFVSKAFDIINYWLNDSISFKEASSAASQRFIELYTQNINRWLQLLKKIVGSDLPINSDFISGEGLFQSYPRTG